MTNKQLLGLQVKRLLSSLSEHGNQYLTEVETDLLQTNLLLAEAIGKLGASFMAIHEAAYAQQSIVSSLSAGSVLSPEITQKLEIAQSEIGRHVNSAVTGLQFQDMTSQLIGRVIKRINGLRDVLAALDSHSAGMLQESDLEEMIELLNGINKALEDQGVKLERELSKAVSQTHMESGDIELF